MVALSLPLVSVAEQRTRVRPALNQLPDLGRQVTGTAPSASSRAVTTYVTGTRFSRLGTWTVFLLGAVSTGGVRSKLSPGTARVPAQVSLPRRLGGPYDT